MTSAIAAVVDYGLTPHRFTPGWELVLSKRSMAAAYLAMAAGFAGAEYLLPPRCSEFKSDGSYEAPRGRGHCAEGNAEL
jgi:hypothetical protein